MRRLAFGGRAFSRRAVARFAISRFAFSWRTPASLVLAPLLVLALIWLPVWQHYRVPTLTLDRAAIDSLRTMPADTRLLALEGQAQRLRTSFPDDAALRQAAAIGAGQLELPTGEQRGITLPFDARDYDGGTPGGALSMASLVVPDTLLQAYEISGNEVYLTQARQVILGFAAFERSLRTDLGNVRNDHAIAARVGVLMRFWRLYRQRADFDEGVARAVLEQVARSAAFLGKASHFNAATNHGVMQNIALLQAAAAFPALPGAPLWRATAASRLRQQLAFYANAEGVVLEHSPAYHRFGTALMGMALELLAWNGLPPIDGLAQKYAHGLAFLERLQRPDGSMPRIGDTVGGAALVDAGVRKNPVAGAGAGAVADPSLPLPDATRVYPSAGYAITQRPVSPTSASELGVSHATLYWSHFVGHGHDVAAEGSFLLWAAGTDWVGNTGYWSYGLPGRDAATGWRGSNAPHTANEAAASTRATALLAYGADTHSHLLDVARTLDAGPRLRRQVVQIDAQRWLVLDSVSAPVAVPVDRLWTLAPQLVVESSGNGLIAQDRTTGWRLRIEFLGDPPFTVRRLRGSVEPFGGWVTNGPQPEPSEAAEIRQEPGSRWTAAVFTLLPPGAAPAASGSVIHYSAEDDWSMSVDSGGQQPIDVQRRRAELMVGADGANGTTARGIGLLTPPPDSINERATIHQALAGTLREFPHFKPLVFYRLRLSYAVGVAALAWLGAWLWVGRRAGRLPALLGALGLLFWITTAAWIHWVYLGV